MKKILYILISFLFLSLVLFYFSNYSNKIKLTKTFILAYDLLTFKKQQYQSLHSQIKQNLLLSKFGELKLDLIKLDERDFYKPLGYLEIINNEIIYLAANGELLSINDKFQKKKIKNNLVSYFNNELKSDDLYVDLFNPYTVNPIRDLLYHNGFLYVVFFNIEKINNELRLSSSVLKGKFNSDYIDFKYFFKPNNYFVKNLNTASRLDATHAGGRIVVDKNENFFIAIPDYGLKKKIKTKKNIFGKVLKKKSKDNYEIISMGHRNPQGFYYDKEKDIFIESEHGPSGGDEINLIKKDRNYGWPTVSSGVGGRDVVVNTYHNHEKHGFEAPIYTWPIYNPGISQIIKIEKSSKSNFRDLYMVASLSGKNEYYGNHLYLFSINKNQTILKDKIFIGDRVRDLIYDKINDRVILTLEDQESIGIINLNNKK